MMIFNSRSEADARLNTMAGAYAQLQAEAAAVKAVGGILSHATTNAMLGAMAALQQGIDEIQKNSAAAQKK
jgi:hypothetical protein